MALKFMDGFEHYTTTALAAGKWTSVSAGGQLTGRNGYGWGLASNGAITWIKTLDAQSTFIVGFAIKLSSLTANYALCELRDTGTQQVGIYLNADGTVTAKRGGSGGTALGSSTFAFSTGNWYYLEFKGFINSSTGTVDVRINGSTSIISLTGKNTQNTANSTANAVYITLGSSTTVGGVIDDLYICDTTGSINKDFLGDVKVETLYPTSDGYSLQWATSTGSTHYALVDEVPPNTTDYVLTSGIGYIDSYGMSDLVSTSGSVFGVQYNMFARKDDAGSRVISPIYYTSSTPYSGSTYSIGDTFQYYLEIKEQNPNTASFWTISEINSLESGVKLVS